jgi:phi13 family phage major tail protein
MGSFRFNIKNLHYALLTKDDATGVTYGAIKAIPGMMSIKMVPKSIDGKVYGDGSVKDQQSMIESIDVDLEMNKIPLENRAEMQGNTYSAGVSDEKDTDKAPDLALGFEIEHTDGKSEYVWLHKGKLAPIGDEVKQREGKIEYGTQKSKFTFIPRDNDHGLRKIADSGAADFVASVATGWFTAVPVPA